MARSYWFECSKCGYRVKVSGREDRGLNVFVQTVNCRDCKELYDAVIRFRIPEEVRDPVRPGLQLPKLLRSRPPTRPWNRNGRPPTLQMVLGRLPYVGFRRFKWLHFEPQCPLSPLHSVEPWNEPGACPKCGVFLDKNAVPYRIWD
jgi:hypothetical protein